MSKLDYLAAFVCPPGILRIVWARKAKDYRRTAMPESAILNDVTYWIDLLPFAIWL